MSILQMRLKNCLQTILELEPVVSKASKKFFASDFSSIRSYLNKVDSMELGEDEVVKVEHITSDIISELYRGNSSMRSRGGILQ